MIYLGARPFVGSLSWSVSQQQRGESQAACIVMFYTADATFLHLYHHYCCNNGSENMFFLM